MPHLHKSIEQISANEILQLTYGSSLIYYIVNYVEGYQDLK
jgi:hypothetical protein